MLLGKQVRVTASTNQQLVGLEGEVVADNKDTLALRTAQGEKLLVKRTITIETK